MSETGIKGINFFKSTNVSSVKETLSEEEVSEVQKHVQKLIGNLDGLINMLRGGALFLRNGKLSTGQVSFAAFRIETLSLIFDCARKYINKGSGIDCYSAFLSDLGHEVGFTYGREMLRNLRDSQCIPADDFALVELWTLFENDTGAGVTTVNRINSNTLEITLKNNPIGYYYSENGQHTHCNFYSEYYRAILNEFMTARPRLAKDFMPDLEPTIWKVDNVTERPRKGLCVFECSIKQETLTRAFDLLNIALIDMDEGKYGDAISSAREALIEAQKKKIFSDSKDVPKNFYKVFQSLLSKKDFKLMDDTYQRSCSICSQIKNNRH